MVIPYSKRRVNRVRLPIVLVVSSTGKMNISLSPFAPKNLVSRDGFDSPVPRQPAHLYTQAESTLGSGGSMVARLKLKEIDGRAPPGKVDP